MIILSGKDIKDSLIKEIKLKLINLDEKYFPVLNIIVDKINFDSYKYYLKSLKKAAALFEIPVKEIDIRDVDSNLFNDNLNNSYMIMKPTSAGFENKIKEITEKIRWHEDPDIITDENLGKIFSHRVDKKTVLPATVESIRSILEFYFTDLLAIRNRTVLIVGRSLTIGKPCAMMMDSYNFTVTVANSKTTSEYLNEIAKKAGMIILCTGKSGLIRRDMLCQDHIIIDCGFSANGGDLGFIPVENELLAYTPVPGGVGALTPYELINNMIRLKIELQEK